ncbi:hypothetical protein TNCV_2277951 [Trichonephila clavipes]|nr:hypothetical protein TNCV_2277951 [Trichonephila clavipes]
MEDGRLYADFRRKCTQGLSGLLRQSFWEGRGHHKESLHSNLWMETSSFGARWHCSHGGNRPALQQSFELLSFTEQYRMFCDQQAGRYPPNLRIGQKEMHKQQKDCIVKGTHRDEPDV